METAGRLIESIPGLERLGGLVIDCPLVLALDDVPEDRPGMAVRYTALTWLKHDLHRRCFSRLAIELLQDAPIRQRGHLRLALVAIVVGGEGQPANNEGDQRREC